jgi:hypothetical protein
MLRIHYVLAGFIFGVVTMVQAQPVRIEGVDFDRRVQVEEQDFDLFGVGLLRYRVLFRAYVGALYLGEGKTAADLWEEATPMHLELEYFWSIDGDQFGPAAVPFLKDNLGAERYAQIEARAEQLSRMYRDVKPGDRCALTYIPRQGTTLRLNGAPIGTIPGDDFAVAYFQIWLGRRPIDDNFRDRILRGL